MNEHIKISSRQREIIIGKLLGDGHLETRTRGNTYRLKIEHGEPQKFYVDWLYHELKTIAANEPQRKVQRVSGKEYVKYWFNTFSTGSLRFYGQQWYRKRKKMIPRQMNRWITPLVLAVWFMDDGSIKSKHHRAKIINTQSFSKEEILRLIDLLDRKYGIKAKLRYQKEGYQIYLLSETIEIFEDMIRPYIIPSMAYKLG